MDEYLGEAKRLAKLLNCDELSSLTDLVLLLQRFSHESFVQRQQLVLQHFFEDRDKPASMNVMQKEAETLNEILPDLSVQHILDLLQEYECEENRVKIVTRKLIRENTGRNLKRGLSNSSFENELAEKRAKIACCTYSNEASTSGLFNDVSGLESKKPETYISSLESESTIIYPLEIERMLKPNTNLSSEENLTNLDCIPLDELFTLTSVENEKNELPSLSKSQEKNDQPGCSYGNKRNEDPIEGKEGHIGVPMDINQDPTMNILATSLYTTNIKEGANPDISNMGEKLAQSEDKVEQFLDTVANETTPGPFNNELYVPENQANRNNWWLLSSKAAAISKRSSNVPETVPSQIATTKNNIKSLSEGVRDVLPPVQQGPTTLGQMITDSKKENHSSTVMFFDSSSDDDMEDYLASVKRPKKDKEEYDIYALLHDMFHDIPLNKIKDICSNYSVNRHRRPQEKIFDYIVSDLMVLRRSKTVSDNVSATIDRVAIGISETPLTQSQERLMGQPSSSSSDQKAPTNMPFKKRQMPTATATSATPNIIERDELMFPLTDVFEDVYDDDDDESDIDEITIEPMENPDSSNFDKVDNSLVSPLMEMFPEACPIFIRGLCAGKTNSLGVLDGLISQILDQDYPKRNKSASPERKMGFEEQLQMLKEIFPDADPDYLQAQCYRLVDKPDDLKVFIANLLETRNYPTMKEYLRKQQISAQQKQYTTEFSVEKFLDVIPDPINYFQDPKRKGASAADESSCHYVMCLLRNKFSRVALRIIRDAVRKNNFNFIQAYKELQTVDPKAYMRSKRGEYPMPQVIQNIPLLQEIAFIEHRQEIEKHIEFKKVQEVEERKATKEAGMLQTCACCFDDEVMPKDIYQCEEGCRFCKDCVRKGCEVAFGDGKLDFACLNNCPSHFSLQTLQAVLNPKMFSKVALKKQVEEVKAAGLEDLETCPFCEFVTIPPKDDKIFKCLNPECMKESCRLCKEPSHLPLRCDEVEKEDDVKIRTFIENKMTEALLRKCYKCGMKFIKSDGCNKMTCSCGAIMCYLCNKPVKDYKHFNGPGGDRFDLCPLYNDTNTFHEAEVLKGAEEAKKEMGLDQNSKLKIDPTADVTQHYNEIKRKKPVIVPPFGGGNVVMNNQGLNDLIARRARNFLRHINQLQLNRLERQRRNNNYQGRGGGPMFDEGFEEDIY